MFLANVATYALSHVPSVAVWMYQEAAVGWDPVSLWKQMGILAKLVVLILFIMSGWSIGVMIDRAMAFSAASAPSTSATATARFSTTTGDRVMATRWS